MNQLENFVGNNKKLVGLVAATAVSYVAAKALCKAATFFKRFVLPGYDLAQRYGKGSYAAISACTDGLGKGFAIQLAKRGFNLVMFVRNVEKAQALADEIKREINKNIDVRIVQVDFLKVDTPGVIEAAVKQVEDLDISILVNNTGLTYINNNSIEVWTEKEMQNMITMNIYSQILLTRYLIPKLRSRGKKSGIINLSSLTCVISMPGFHMYTACKLFNDYFSKSIGEEYKGIIDVLSYQPGWIDTPLVSSVSKKPLCLSPCEAANAALKHLGRFEETHGHYKYYIAGLYQVAMKSSINNKLRYYAKKQRDGLNKSS